MNKPILSKRDVYLEIAERYEKYIELGVIKPGEKLPSVRVAAGELRVNPNTVQKAYSYLEEKGLIRAMPKKGAFVLPYKGQRDDDRGDLQALTAELIRLKNGGRSKNDIISLVEEVYKND